MIFGATGYSGKDIVRKLQKTENMEISVFVINPDKFETMNYSDVENVTNNLSMTKILIVRIMMT